MTLFEPPGSFSEFFARALRAFARERDNHRVPRGVVGHDASPAKRAGNAAGPVAVRKHLDAWIWTCAKLEINWTDGARDRESQENGRERPHLHPAPVGDGENH